MFACRYLCVPHAYACWGQKSSSDLLEGSYKWFWAIMYILRNTPGFSPRAASALSGRASLQPLGVGILSGIWTSQLQNSASSVHNRKEARDRWSETPVSSSFSSAKTHNPASEGPVCLALHQWSLQATSLEEEGREFSSQIAMPRCTIKQNKIK